MIRGKIITAATLALLAAAAANGAAPKKAVEPVGGAALAKTLDCSSHRFETTLHLTGPDGKVEDKTVRMCGIKGESDAQWVTTLRDAVKKTTDNAQMPQAAREQIITSVNAEIGRLTSPMLSLPQVGDIAKLPRTAAKNAPEVPLSRDYSALPPLPTAATVPPPHLLGPNGAIADTAHITLRCALLGDEDRPDKCASIDKDTVLVVRADEAYPKGLAMRFLRHGEPHATVDLPAMGAGEITKVRLPRAVCTGVVRSRLEIDALGGNAPNGASPGKVGDYDLRC